MRGEATETSDLDLVVVYEQLPHAFREAFVYEGWPVESFVQDPETAEHYFEYERQRGIPSLICMVREGFEIPRADAFSDALKRRATEIFDVGPPEWDAAEMLLRRYRLTDWVDDIRHPRSSEELIASGASLYADAADFYFRAHKLWSSHSKTIPRRLRELDTAFAEKFTRAFDALFAERRQAPAIALIEELLAPFGGLLFEGFRRDSRPQDRKKDER
jgi:hypothetical protein